MDNLRSAVSLPGGNNKPVYAVFYHIRPAASIFSDRPAKTPLPARPGGVAAIYFLRSEEAE
jgi:hypothetical protein